MYYSGHDWDAHGQIRLAVSPTVLPPMGKVDGKVQSSVHNTVIHCKGHIRGCVVVFVRRLLPFKQHTLNTCVLV